MHHHGEKKYSGLALIHSGKGYEDVCRQAVGKCQMLDASEVRDSRTPVRVHICVDVDANGDNGGEGLDTDGVAWPETTAG